MKNPHSTRRPGRGKILSIKWGLNPNSSSLGVDVTFLLLGAAALSVATPFVSALVRLRMATAGTIDKANVAKAEARPEDEDGLKNA